MHILLLNAGSSSLKASVVDAAASMDIASCRAEWSGTTANHEFTDSADRVRSASLETPGHGDAVRRFLADFRGQGQSRIDAVGHRIVHGGALTRAVRIDDRIQGLVQSLIDLAPLHNPPSLEALAAAKAELPDVPHVAVFDTAFHSTIPPEARTYPVPARWTKEWGIRRYGFHGLSHAYCARRAAEMIGKPLESTRIVVCHLGHGCSATAVAGGKSVDTTMGFTPLDGLMMATRCGSLDPGALLHVMQRHGMSVADAERDLNRNSGLLGVSGFSADMRAVLAAADAGQAEAKLAVGIYVRRVRQAIGAFAVTLGGLDALVFTAGVGEHSPAIRAAICGGLECLGGRVNLSSNAAIKPDADIAYPDSSFRILVIATREDVTMLREVMGVLEAKS